MGIGLKAPNRLSLGAIAAWLGMIALGFNALVPIHLAFDLADNFASGGRQRGVGAAEHGLEWRVLALVTGHDEPEAKPDGHHGPQHDADCAVCSSLGTLAGFAPAAAVPLPVPVRVEAPILLAAAASEPPAAPAVAYRSRAPPFATADPNT
jgi:Protein of unknown function (DUF2946)